MPSESSTKVNSTPQLVFTETTPNLTLHNFIHRIAATRSVEIFRIAAGDNFTLILDGEGAMMLIGANPVNEGSEEGCMIPLVLHYSDIKGVDNIVTGVAAGGRHIGVLAPKRFPASTLF